MSVNQLLLWEKYRPKNIGDVILLPRIKKIFENGVTKNYIFHGHYGTGKTTLARILIGKYDKSKPYLEINSSLLTSIDVLRTEVENFCKTKPMFDGESDIKYVFLDEFERVSAQYQDAFKAFIEKYHQNVRFILTTNHINKISQGTKSRFELVNFDCENIEEEKFLKTAFYKRVNEYILPKESKEITKDKLITIINKTFPDFRAAIMKLQSFIETGDIDSSSIAVSNKIRLELYNILYDKTIDYEKTYHFLMNVFGADKIDSMIKLLGKPFIEYCMAEGKNIDKLFECNYIISEYSDKLETNTDPIVLGMTIIGKLRDVLN
jgi:DNA polymerase III delta prime subunit